MRDFQTPGRSPVLASTAMAATSHPLAAGVAVDLIRRGGNAVDAAIGAALVLGICEPHMTGIGGDCFALIQSADGRTHGINGSGRAPPPPCAGAPRGKMGRRRVGEEGRTPGSPEP